MGARHLVFRWWEEGAHHPAPWQPARRRGFWNSCLLLPPPPPVPRGTQPRIVPSDHKWGFVFLRQRPRSSPRPEPGLVAVPRSGPQKRCCPSQEEELRSREGQV